MGETIEALVDAGKASAGPPLGPSLGPTGVNVKDVVDEINSKTKEMAGMQVPVKIKIDDKKGFTIDIGTPPASSLIKQVLDCLLYTSPSPRDVRSSRMPSSA